MVTDTSHGSTLGMVEMADAMQTDSTGFEARLSRRRAAKLFAGAVLAAVPVAGMARDASAGRAWCRKDPIFEIEGELLHIYLSGPAAIEDDVTGPSVVTLYVPKRAKTRFIWADEGFAGLGYDVRIEHVDWLTIDPDSGKVATQTDVYVPAKKRHRVQVEAVHERASNDKVMWEQRQGDTNATIRVKAKV